MTSNLYSWKTLRWRNAAFLGGVTALAVTAAPWYLWRQGLESYLAALFVLFFVLSGLSITLGYHRLFSHRSFQAAWPVRLGTLLFGAAAFENSALYWAADHRRHHKFVDGERDPYNIHEGFLHAHLGWILFRSREETETTLESVKDLQRDPLVIWQHRYYGPIAISMGLVLPALLGGIWGGWTGMLGGLLIPGIARTVFVQQMTFFINSLCHTWGRQPYSSRCTARDSAWMALFTFGEGYHNFHHEFQHDYRNGVKAWQFDPTKWTIWLLHRLGLAKDLKRIPEAEILKREIAEQQRRLAGRFQTPGVAQGQTVHELLRTAHDRFQHALADWEQRRAAYRQAAARRREVSRERVAELRRDLRRAREQLRVALRDWRAVCRRARLQFA